MKLRLADATERFIPTIVASNAHAVLLTGPVGVGLGTLARHIAHQAGAILADVVPESTGAALPSISVERIRELYTETRGVHSRRHVVIIDDADAMNHVAQNALLKLLEEPSRSIIFILTTHSPDKLLPTIRSRVQTFSVPPISAIESSRHLKSLGVTDTLTEQRLMFVAEGLPAEMGRLVSNQSDFTSLLERVQIARQFVEGSPYQRLVVVSGFTGDRKAALMFIEMTLMLLRRSLSARPDGSTLSRIQALLDASSAIRMNGNIKLHLSVAAA